MEVVTECALSIIFSPFSQNVHLACNIEGSLRRFCSVRVANIVDQGCET